MKPELQDNLTSAVNPPSESDTASCLPLSSQERLCARLLSHAAFVSNTQEYKWSEILDKVEFFFDASVVKKAGEFLRNEIGSNF
jgi:hypothetical protein